MKYHLIILIALLLVGCSPRYQTRIILPDEEYTGLVRITEDRNASKLLSQSLKEKLTGRGEIRVYVPKDGLVSAKDLEDTLGSWQKIRIEYPEGNVLHGVEIAAVSEREVKGKKIWILPIRIKPKPLRKNYFIGTRQELEIFLKGGFNP